MKLIFKPMRIRKRCQQCAQADGVPGHKGNTSIRCDVDGLLRDKNDNCNHFIAAFKEFKRLI